MDCPHCQRPCQTNRTAQLKTWLNRLWNNSPDLIERSLEPQDQIILVGAPNVGKSVVFHALTGAYATVSNYPGTTVEIAQGHLTLAGQSFTVVDTPGLYSLLPLTEEEQVTRDLLLRAAATLIVHVVDAKNLNRMLPLTLQLIEAGFPVLLVLNMMDEAHRLGLTIDSQQLEQRLAIPVVTTTAAKHIGIDTLKARISAHVHSTRVPTAG